MSRFFERTPHRFPLFEIQNSSISAKVNFVSSSAVIRIASVAAGWRDIARQPSKRVWSGCANVVKKQRAKQALPFAKANDSASLQSS